MRESQPISANDATRYRPTLVVVEGPAGTGKTTLAHELARRIGCPVLCRDEIKEGMVHARGDGGFVAARGDELTVRASAVFFEVLMSLLDAGVTVVAEAAFQDKVWTPQLRLLDDLADIRIVRCHADEVTARARLGVRGESRRAHADADVLADDGYYENFVRVAFPAPSIGVDTTHAYAPSLDDVVAFVTDAAGGARD